MGLSRIKY